MWLTETIGLLIGCKLDNNRWLHDASRRPSSGGGSERTRCFTLNASTMVTAVWQLLSPEAGACSSRSQEKSHTAATPLPISSVCGTVRGLMQEGMTAEEIRTHLVVELPPEPEIKVSLMKRKKDFAQNADR